MRPGRLLVFSVLCAVAAAGCSGVDAVDAPAPGATPAPPGSIDRLTVAVAEDVGPLNIFASHEEPLTELVHDKLLAPSPYVDSPQPWLATAVRSLDPSIWEVDLRSGVRWHDGEAFDVADVVFTINYFKAAPTGRWTHHVSDIPTISDVVATDADTVRFSCAFPCPDLGTVTLADLPIIPEHVWSAVPAAEAKAAAALPIGTGPYRLTDYSAAGGYRFEANPEYFAGQPRVRELAMPVIADASAAFTALRSGQIDATTHHVPPELIDQLSSDGGDGIEVTKTAPLQFPELLLNYERAPFDDPTFRKAISRAVDRQQLLDVVFLGKGRVADKGYPHPDAPFANPSLSTPHDPNEARSLLDELGFTDSDGDGVREGPDGPLAYTLYVEGASGVRARFAELVAEDLDEIGIAAEVETLDVGSMAALSTSRDYDLRLSQISAHGVADPMQFIMSHRSGYLWKAPTIPYPEWDALFEQWKATTTLDAREAVMQQMQVLFNDAPTSIPLNYPDEYWAHRDSYDGWVESPGYGVVHKWSLLPREVARDARAIVEAG
ncbi:MAG: ABC transporter substrate-binding protein [Sporichthyaceae bacterium]